MIAKEEIFYEVSKTVSRVLKLDDTTSYTQKKITLRPEEAKLLLSHGVTVYREEITRPDGGRCSRLFCYITMEQLINALK